MAPDPGTRVRTQHHHAFYGKASQGSDGPINPASAGYDSIRAVPNPRATSNLDVVEDGRDPLKV